MKIETNNLKLTQIREISPYSHIFFIRNGSYLNYGENNLFVRKIKALFRPIVITNIAEHIIRSVKSERL